MTLRDVQETNRVLGHLLASSRDRENKLILFAYGC
jgi:hypothetical protein